MNDIRWKLQSNINENTQTQLECMNKQIEILIGIVEDHEKDMIAMADIINNLTRQLNERES